MDPDQTCSNCAALDFTRSAQVRYHSTIQEASVSECPLCQYMARCVQGIQIRLGKAKKPPILDPDVSQCLWVKTWATEHRAMLTCGYGPVYSNEAAADTKWFGHENCQEHDVLGDTGSQELLVGCPIKACIDVDRIRQWLEGCDVRHKHACRSLTTRSRLDACIVQGSLHLLDVWSLRASNIQTLTVPRYVALSYVWGSTVPVSHSQSWDLATLPRTLRDAVALVRSLSIQYIWIDQICIDQIHDDIHNVLKCMGAIYENAVFTIVAASGDDADSGLAGMPDTPRSDEEILCSFWNDRARTYLDVARPRTWAFHDINKCQWSTRAWTFQELVCAKRALLFLPKEIVFICQEHFTSDKFAQTEYYHHNEMPATLFTLRELRANLVSGTPRFLNYSRTVEKYSELQLTREEDRLAAFAGVLASDRADDTIPLSCGLLISNFLFGPGLAWQLGDVDNRYRAMSNRRSPLAPSWSWVSAGREISYMHVGVSNLVRSFEYSASFDHSAVVGRPDSSFWQSSYMRDIIGMVSESSWSESIMEAHKSSMVNVEQHADVSAMLPILKLITICFTARLGHQGRTGECMGFQLVPNQAWTLTASPSLPVDEPDWPWQSVYVDTGKYGQPPRNQPLDFAVVWVNHISSPETRGSLSLMNKSDHDTVILDLFSELEGKSTFSTLLLRRHGKRYERVGLARVSPQKMTQLLVCKDSGARWQYIEIV